MGDKKKVDRKLRCDDGLRETEVIRSQANNIILNYFKQPKPSHSPADQAFKETAIFLKTHPELVVLTSDKGNATVIMYNEEYLTLSSRLLEDDHYYKPLSRDPTPTFTTKINNFITNLKKDKLLDQNIAKLLHSYNGYAPRFYCLPKIHKPQLCMRPIVSSINAPNGNIVNFLTNILTKAYDADNQFNITDSFKFANFIIDFKLHEGYMLVSFDVISLFSNLPLSVVLTSIHKHWDIIQPSSQISWEVFSKLLKLVFETNYLIFNNQFYLQIFGTPMGSSISPILVNFVLDDLVKNRLHSLTFHVPFVKRYVDDLILALPPDKVQSTLSHFNAYDPHLQFTCELESHNSIAFLDMRGCDFRLSTSWYRKEMASNRFLNYNSCHAMRYKYNLVQALSFRVHRLTHPSHGRDSLNLLNYTLSRDSLTDNSQVQGHPDISIGTPENDSHSIPSSHIRYYSLPYFPHLTEKLAKLLTLAPVKIGVKNVRSVGKLFSKTKTPLKPLEKINVVYNIPCMDCNLCYIGQTRRSLKGRLTSHKSDIRCHKHSCALAQHILTSDHRPDYEQVKILCTESNHFKRSFLEMCHIFLNPSSMNKRTDINNLSLLYHFLLSNIK
ncbi:uncharacterized protein [Diabrotica undecimpunctata]|uniref:uncharacterized protein n=1 Tax=Diabrotica undecimpunctata TaxID=50387 RepID=UPI003B6366FD